MSKSAVDCKNGLTFTVYDWQYAGLNVQVTGDYIARVRIYYISIYSKYETERYNRLWSKSAVDCKSAHLSIFRTHFTFLVERISNQKLETILPRARGLDQDDNQSVKSRLCTTTQLELKENEGLSPSFIVSFYPDSCSPCMSEIILCWRRSTETAEGLVEPEFCPSTDLALFHGTLFWCFRLFTFLTLFRISQLFGLSITDMTEETWFVEVHIWCIKISTVRVSHFHPWLEAFALGL
jgi:hypothetical protein